MKRLLALFLMAAFFACNNSSDNQTSDETKPGETKVASISTTDLAYPLKDWGDWQPGSADNLKLALQAVKDWETGNMEACMNAFADSINLTFDEWEGKFTKDSVQKMFTGDRGKMKTLKIDMEDYETVKSKDGTREYVSLWYKQKWEDQNGKWDSLFCMDDIRIKDGKIVSIDEKIRHFPKKKM